MNRRLVGLSAVAAVLAAYLLIGNGRTPPAPPAVQQPAQKQGTGRAGVKLNPLDGLDPQSFTALAERPLFNPGRKPRPAAVLEEEPAPAAEQQAEPPPAAADGPGPEDYRLLGVAEGPAGRVAALRPAAGEQVLYVREGEAIDSWTVLRIDARSVTIGTPENGVTYALFQNDMTQAPAAPEPPPEDGAPQESVPQQASPQPAGQGAGADQ